VAVAIRIPTALRSRAGGQSSLEVDGATIGAVLQGLVSSYPDLAGQVFGADGELHRFVNVYVNDDDVRYMSGLDTPVADGDQVTLLPAVAGGA